MIKYAAQRHDGSEQGSGAVLDVIVGLNADMTANPGWADCRRRRRASMIVVRYMKR